MSNFATRAAAAKQMIQAAQFTSEQFYQTAKSWLVACGLKPSEIKSRESSGTFG